MSEKKKKVSPFQEQLWEDEKLLWTGQAEMSWWEYGNLEAPENAIARWNEAHPLKSKNGGCVGVMTLIMSASIALLLTATILQSLFPIISSFKPMSSVVYIIVVIPIFFGLIFVLPQIVWKFVVRPIAIILTRNYSNLLSKGTLPDVWYAISDYRIYTLSKSITKHLMFYDLMA